MELHVESFALAPLIDEVGKAYLTAGGEDRQPGRSSLRRCDRDDACRPDAAAPGTVEPMSNANKFTEKGTVIIAAQDGRDWITITVTDTGIGMTEEQMGKLFQEFLRRPRLQRASTAVLALGS